jgi:hypothetical protein
VSSDLTRPATRVAAVALGLALVGWCEPAWADPTPTPSETFAAVPGYAVQRVSALPASIMPGNTLSVTIALSQTTQYTLHCMQGVQFRLFPWTSTDYVDVAVRAQDPVTGVWVDGVQHQPAALTVVPSVDVSITIDDAFDLHPPDQLTVHVEITLGPAAPMARYTFVLGVGCVPLGAGPGVDVVMESVRMFQDIQVGTPRSTNPFPAAPPANPPPAGPAPAGPAASTSSPTPPPTSAGPTTVAPAPGPSAGTVLGSRPTPGQSPAGGFPAGRLAIGGAALGATWILLVAAYLRRIRRRRALTDRAA